MYETTGAVTVVEPSALLLLIVLPALLCLGAATAGSRRSLRVRISLAGGAGTLAYSVVLAYRLASIPRGHVLGEHVASLLRLGQLDLVLDLVLDPLSCAFAVLVAFLSLASVLYEIWSGKDDRRLVWIGALTASTLLVVLGDGVAAVVAGLGASAVSAFAMTAGARRRTSALAALSDASLVLGFSLLFWSLGGSFGRGGYETDSLGRVALVTTDSLDVEPGLGRATLTMTTPAGSRVTTDDGPPLAGEPLRAPFTVSADPGIYTFRIRTGEASADMVVPRVSVEVGRSYVLSPYGPTTSLLGLFAQERTPRSTPAGAILGVQGLLAERVVLGVSAALVIAILLAVALAGRLFAFAARESASGATLVVEVIGPSYLALRLAPILDPAGASGAAFALVGSVAGLVLAGGAAIATERARVVRGVLGASGAVVLVAAGVGEVAGGFVLIASASLAAAAALASDGRDSRWLGVACAAAVGLLPFAGTSAGLASVLAVALASARPAGVGAAACATVAFWLCSFALFELHRASRRRTGDGAPGHAFLVAMLGAVALGSGIVLGAGTQPFGGVSAPLVTRLLGARGLPPARVLSAAGVGLGFAAAVTGLYSAGSTGARAYAVAIAGLPTAAASFVARAALEASSFLARGVATIDLRLLDRVGPTAAGVVIAAGRVASSRRRASGERAARLIDAGFARVGLDDPRVAACATSAVVTAAVLAIALVLLSPFFGGRP